MYVIVSLYLFGEFNYSRITGFSILRQLIRLKCPKQYFMWTLENYPPKKPSLSLSILHVHVIDIIENFLNSIYRNRQTSIISKKY